MSVSRGNSLSTSVREGRLNSLKESGTQSLQLQVFLGNRQASLSTSLLTRDVAMRLVAEGITMAALADADPYIGLPDESCGSVASSAELRCFDPETMILGMEPLVEMARRADQAACDADRRIMGTDGGTCVRRYTSTAIADSRGFAAAYQSSSWTLACSAYAMDGTQRQRGTWSSSNPSMAGLSTPETTGQRAAARCLRRLGGRRVEPCHVPVVCEDTAGREILRLAVAAADGYRYRPRDSWLFAREGKRVGSDLVTIIDDPTLPGLAASRPFDGEGLSTQRNLIVERGSFVGFLFDSYSARTAHRCTTHSARFGGTAGGVTTHNLYLQPGVGSSADIIASVDNGLFLTDLTGGSTDPGTGRFAYSAAGIWIQQGRLTFPVNDLIVSGCLPDLLANIDSVAEALDWRAAVAAPTFRVTRLRVRCR